MTLRIRPFRRDDTESVVALWRAAGLVVPWNDPYRDIERKLTVQPDLFLVGTEPVGTDADDESDAVLAVVMVGFDGHRGWLNYLAVDPDARRRGYGATLVAEAERLLTERGCPKLSLLVRSTNAEVIAWYESLGYTTDSAVPLGKRLIPDA